MTKKHFIAIAKLLKNKRLAIQHLTNPTTIKGTENIITNIENGLIEIFIDDNPRFDIDKFKQATQLTEEERKLAI